MNLILFLVVISQTPQWELNIDPGAVNAGAMRANILGVTNIWSTLPNPNSAIIINSVTFDFRVGDEIQSSTARYFCREVGSTKQWIKFTEPADLTSFISSDSSQYSSSFGEMWYKVIDSYTNSPEVSGTVKAGSSVIKVFTANVDGTVMPTGLWRSISTQGDPFYKDSIKLKPQLYTGFKPGQTITVWVDIGASLITGATRTFYNTGIPWELDITSAPNRHMDNRVGEWRGPAAGLMR